MPKAAAMPTMPVTLARRRHVRAAPGATERRLVAADAPQPITLADRHRIASNIEQLLAFLALLDQDDDQQDHDGCEDDVILGTHRGAGIGDEEDAEDGDPAEDGGDAEPTPDDLPEPYDDTPLRNWRPMNQAGPGPFQLDSATYAAVRGYSVPPGRRP